MLMVIFEFTVKSGKSQSYFELVESMRRQVENVEGFLGVERFQSCNDKNRFISVLKGVGARNGFLELNIHSKNLK